MTKPTGKQAIVTQANASQSDTKTTPAKGGRLTYRLTNDYLFRATLQKNPKALEGLCRAILGAKPEDKVSAKVKNPIVLGEAIEDKEFILDILVEINGHYIINLEMQVLNESNWNDRSLAYACRSFDSLVRGEEYTDAPFVHHIGFLDFTLFPDDPAFFSTYKLINIKNSKQIFNDKFTISVVDLNHTELATETDRANSLDLWAKAFKAATWEELDMLGNENEYIKSAVATVAELSADEQIRQRMQARKDYELWERKRLAKMKKQEAELAEKDAALAQKDAALAQKDAENAALRAELEALKANK